jgi:PBP1b-binding outer membrane lipoprotein LpoB
MKTSIITAVTLIISAFIITSCNNEETSKTQVNDEEKKEIKKTEPVKTEAINIKINQVEVDAKRMAFLSCKAQSNISKGKKEGTSKEEVKAQNEPLNAEMTEISERFEKEYANNEKKDEFQKILQEELKECNNQ